MIFPPTSLVCLIRAQIPDLLKPGGTPCGSGGTSKAGTAYTLSTKSESFLIGDVGLATRN